MDPQHPPVPLSATHANQSPQSHHSAPVAEYVYNEKDAYSQHQNIRAERGSKQYGRGRDSVISHPFSPKQSYPPSPTSSISSVGGRKHYATSEIQPASRPISDAQNITCPPRVYLDPEKQSYDALHEPRSHRNSAVRGASDAVYDQSEYHEKAPEEKAWQLLVSNSRRMTWDMNTNDRPVLPVRPLRVSLHRHHSLDHRRALRLARPCTAGIVHQTPLPLDTAHHLSRARTEPAITPRVLAQRLARLQRADARSYPPVLPNHRVWRCDCRMDSSRLLVLFEHTRRPGRSRRPQRRQGEHSGCEELVGTMVISWIAVITTPSSFHPHIPAPVRDSIATAPLFSAAYDMA
jgi:hypothetical protein